MLFKHFVHTVKNILLNLRLCKVKHKLIAKFVVFPRRIVINPVGVRSEQIAVTLYHFGLKPQAEVHTERINAVNKLVKTVGKFFLINKPVAKTCAVVISFSEPAVVHNKKLASKLCRLFCKLKLTFCVNVKRRSLPRIIQNGKRLFGVSSRQNMINRKTAHIVAHLGKAV